MPIEVSDLPGNLVGRFEGKDHGSSVSFFIGTFDAGTGPGLHLHPYDETFIVEAGSATFTVGDATSTGVGVVSGEAASRDRATELTGGVGATELLHPAVKTT